jgi:FkbM family methyltransferase
MPASRAQRARVKLHTLMPWRRVYPNRTVRRRVQGVELYMPWAHVLPDYARERPWYGQNLVELAGALARQDGSAHEFRFVDIGANIGDSTLQVLNRVEGRALCIEGDEYWAEYLHMNVGSDPRVTIEEVMLGTESATAEFAAVRGGGTTAFYPSGEKAGEKSTVAVAEVNARNPEFARTRLIKSDTDGFDPLLVPAAARGWSDAGPVLFFEFDPGLARKVAGCDPHRLWEELADLGYSRIAVWDNTGDPLGQLEIDAAPDAAAILDDPPPGLGYSFWDVAACREDDAAGLAALDELTAGLRFG